MNDYMSSTTPYTVRRSRQQMLRDVRQGLTQAPKRLSPKYFYDERGSELFEQITNLPEYYLTRAERALLQRVIPEIIDTVRPRSLVELGAGSASKTRIILDTMMHRDLAESYVPIDVSREFLETTAGVLREDYPRIVITPVVSDITEPFALPPLESPVLIAFLGSTIGNFSRDAAVALLSHVARLMRPDDAFLLGADLRKEPAVLNAAYNDAQGITAAFNLNILERLNRELGADFEVGRFRHQAYYSIEHCRIEMHLVALSPMTVTVPEIGQLQFAEGETIRTEVSYKYDLDTLSGILADSGMRLEKWLPDSDDVFALALARVAR
jgi:L-histidine Nalpha-methyltransferase